MATIVISEADAIRDFAGLLARVRAGDEVRRGNDADPGVFVRMSRCSAGRTVSESLALAEAHAKEKGFEAEMDPEFMDDLEEIIRNRKPRDTSAWD